MVVQDVLAGGAGSAVKLDAGLGSAAPGGEGVPPRKALRTGSSETQGGCVH